MTKILSVLIGVLLLATSSISQSTSIKPAHKIAFKSINQFGLLTGGNGQSGTLQTINGVQLNKWFAGVGAGIDYYGTRGVPLFLDVRKELLNKKNSPFIYADGGIHIPWATAAQNQNKAYLGEDKKGAYFDGGLGIKLQTKSIGAILLSAGYSYKQVKSKAEMFTIWSFPTPVRSYEYYNYQYRRIVVKIGLEF